MSLIKPQDLRIGNSIFSRETESVITVDADDIKYCYDDNFRFNKYFSPIPLTKEVFVKCVFNKFLSHIKGTEHYDEYECGILRIKNIFGEFRFHGIQIKYLHHLQNLYHALTGEELIYNP